jgi:hypothetical protein
VAVIVAILASRRGARARLEAEWQRQLRAVYSEGAALQDAAAVEYASDRPASPAHDPLVQQRWSEMEGRLNSLATSLHAMETAPLEPDWVPLVQDALATMATLRMAIERDRGVRTQGGGEQQAREAAESVRRRLGEFQKALQTLRAGPKAAAEAAASS